jgi:hypothetical protein
LSVKIEDLIDGPQVSHKMSVEDHQELKQSCINFLLLAESLHKHYASQGLDLFNFTIKSHYLCHIADQSAYISPRACWCYSGENFMNICKRIVTSCVRGTKPIGVATKSTRKFVEGMGYSVFGRSFWR